MGDTSQITVNANGWVNEGTIAISNSSDAELGGSWTNSVGANISVDSTSTLALGSRDWPSTPPLLMPPVMFG